MDSDGGFEGDYQLLCDIKHHGDVMDLQVSLYSVQKLVFKKRRVIDLEMQRTLSLSGLTLGLQETIFYRL